MVFRFYKKTVAFLGFSFLTHLEMLFINGLVIISIYLIWYSLCEHGVKKVMGIVYESYRCAINAGY